MFQCSPRRHVAFSYADRCTTASTWILQRASRLIHPSDVRNHRPNNSHHGVSRAGALRCQGVYLLVSAAMLEESTLSVLSGWPTGHRLNRLLSATAWPECQSYSVNGCKSGVMRPMRCSRKTQNAARSPQSTGMSWALARYAAANIIGTESSPRLLDNQVTSYIVLWRHVPLRKASTVAAHPFYRRHMP